MSPLEDFLRQSLEDFALSRSEKKELKVHLSSIAGNATEQAKARQLSFQLAHQAIEEFGQITALDWLQSVTKLIYTQENKIKAEAFYSPGDDCLNRIRRLISEARQDESRIRKQQGPLMFNVMRKIAMALFKQDKTKSASMKAKRKMAGLDDKFRSTLIESGIKMR